MGLYAKAKIKRARSITAAVMTIFAEYPKGYHFYGNWLKRDYVRIFPAGRRKYTESYLRMMRRHCHGLYRVIDQNKSLYAKV